MGVWAFVTGLSPMFSFLSFDDTIYVVHSDSHIIGLANSEITRFKIDRR